MKDQQTFCCGDIHIAVMNECACGGGGPNDAHTCPACRVYHRLLSLHTPPEPLPPATGSEHKPEDAIDAARMAIWSAWPWLHGDMKHWREVPPEPLEAAINAWLAWTHNTPSSAPTCSATEPAEPSYAAWLESLAIGCNCEDGPCSGCQQGAMCECSPNAQAEARRDP
jgi:hypothetical protein